MSKRGLKAAIEAGERLPAIGDAGEAERFLIGERDRHLALLEAAAGPALSPGLDYSPESLKRLEAWYFALWETDGFGAAGLGRAEFERAMGFYLGAVMVRHILAARWIVEACAFVPGRCEIGVKARYGAVMVWNRFADYHRTPNNKRRQSLFRFYRLLADLAEG